MSIIEKNKRAKNSKTPTATLYSPSIGFVSYHKKFNNRQNKFIQVYAIVNLLTISYE